MELPVPPHPTTKILTSRLNSSSRSLCVSMIDCGFPSLACGAWRVTIERGIVNQ
jgi:hypothetical protein